MLTYSDIFEDEEITGGWEQAESPVMTDEEKQVFDKAFGSGNTGFDGGYKISPVAILSYQVVAGENYCFLAKNDSDGSYVFAYCYEDLDGNVSDDYTVDFITKDAESSDAEDEEQPEGDNTVTETASYKFDADMFAEMAKENTGSFVFSPYSIKDCITLTYDGMSDDAKSALEQEGISASAVDDMIRFDDTVSGYDCINIANKLYLNKDDAGQYKTELIRKDGEELVKMDSQTAGRINKWIEEQTNGRIKDLIDADSITSKTAMVPVNALWMKLSWMDEFDEDEIEWKQDGAAEKKYKGFSGTINNTDVVGTDKGYMIRLSYSPEYSKDKTSSDGPLLFSMYIFIDNDDNNGEKIRADITNGGVDFQTLQKTFDYNAGLADCDEVNLHMPDFKSEYKSDVKGALEKVGLSEIMPAEAYEKIGSMEVAQIMHGAYIDTDENGTEAAAATAEMMAGSTGAAEPPVIKDVYVDHPFAYVIKEDTNDGTDGQILFEGIVMSDALQEE